jgi:thiol-disulfide isomerase/thioredoxin
MRYLRFLVLAFCLGLVYVQHSQAEGEADFALPDIDGKQHQLSDYRGKWVLVNYWATWCPPCRKELPELEIFHTGSEGRAVVLGVNMEEIDLEPLKAFVEDQFLSFPILLAGAAPDAAQRVGPVPGLPTSYLVSPEGKVVAKQTGPVTADAIYQFIESYESKHSAKSG